MYEIKHQITINASKEKIINAITEEEGLKSWWTKDTEAKPEVGSFSTFGFFNKSVIFKMKIEKISKDQVGWICMDGPPEWIGTNLTWNLRGDSKKTILNFRHSNWKKDDNDFPRSNTTWGHLMVLLKNYCEGEKFKLYFT